MDFGFRWDSTYAGLPSFFYQFNRPEAMPSPRMLVFNANLAKELSLNALALNTQDGANFFGGKVDAPGVKPLAQAYAGHQFGRFTMLGDGRALLYGEHLTPDARRFDIHLKGAGATSYSRRGDGRAAVGPMLREYVISEAMHALGIPTTRSLAVVATGDEVYRDQIHPGAILVRVAQSHLRVGTFEYAAAFHEGPEMVRELAEYAIKRHHPDLEGFEKPYLEFGKRVTSMQVALITEWMRVGFVHGVMNTDNMSISGESMDFGPCAFMDRYDPLTVFSFIDRNGRYAFARQPEIAQWNLARFWETLLPLLHDDHAEAVKIATACVRDFSVQFQASWLKMMCAKLGLNVASNQDQTMIDALLSIMASSHLDYTGTFLTLMRSLDGAVVTSDCPMGLSSWMEDWRRRIESQSGGVVAALMLMRKNNPVYIPRNHLVEEALFAAEHHDDLMPLFNLVRVLIDPYHEQAGMDRYETAAENQGSPYRTFCGT